VREFSERMVTWSKHVKLDDQAVAQMEEDEGLISTCFGPPLLQVLNPTP
jgi:hypothetical protein